MWLPITIVSTALLVSLFVTYREKRSLSIHLSSTSLWAPVFILRRRQSGQYSPAPTTLSPLPSSGSAYGSYQRDVEEEVE
jgi:hypothetical protein